MTTTTNRPADIAFVQMLRERFLAPNLTVRASELGQEMKKKTVPAKRMVKKPLA